MGGITSLSESETTKRFGVSKDIKNFPSNLTKEEERNIKTVLNYMDVWSHFCFGSSTSILTHYRLPIRLHTAALLL